MKVTRGASAPIMAYVGANGSGKTLGAITQVVVPALDEGRRVVTTAPVHHDLAEPLTSWRQIPDLRNCVLFLDEINASFPSRQYASMPVQLQRVLHQLRKVDVQVVWTAPAWGRADVLLREVTQSVTVCRSYLADPWARDSFGKVLRDAEGRRVRWAGAWRPMRLFKWTQYDARDYQDASDRVQARIRPRATEWWWRPGKREPALYDTRAAVYLLDHLDVAGTCLACGGRRAAPKCACPSEDRVSLADLEEATQSPSRSEAIPVALVTSGGS